MHDSETPQPEAVPARGISKASYLRDGYPVVHLTDSQKRCIASITLVRGLEPSLVRRVLRELLEAADPQRPRLRLLKDTR